MVEKVNENGKKVVIDQQLKEHLQLSQILIKYCLSCKKKSGQQQGLCELLYNYYEIAKNHLEVDKKSGSGFYNNVSSGVYEHYELFVNDLKHIIDSYENGRSNLPPEIYDKIALQNEEHLMLHLKDSEVLSYIPA